jgi:hypothetical protein
MIEGKDRFAASKFRTTIDHCNYPAILEFKLIHWLFGAYDSLPIRQTKPWQVN